MSYALAIPFRWTLKVSDVTLSFSHIQAITLPFELPLITPSVFCCTNYTGITQNWRVHSYFTMATDYFFQPTDCSLVAGTKCLLVVGRFNILRCLFSKSFKWMYSYLISQRARSRNARVLRVATTVLRIDSCDNGLNMFG